MSDTFRAMIVRETDDKKYIRRISEKTLEELPEGEVLIRVRYSSLNYKDALSATGNKGVTRKFPHTPGIDASGEVASSESSEFQPGDKVLVTGYDLGMNTSGGFEQYIRVPASWIVRLPDNLSYRESMVYGTAGFTASMSVLRLTRHGFKPESGDVLVTGATGGVGAIAVSILAKLGYRVFGLSGKPDAEKYLLSLGAQGAIPRDDVASQPDRPLLDRKWAAVVDTVGGRILANAIKLADYQAPVTTCGNIAGADLDMTVYPFILRGITLYGINSANCPMEERKVLWKHMATDWKPDNLDQLSREIGLEGLDREIDLMLEGKGQGRKVVNVNL